MIGCGCGVRRAVDGEWVVSLGLLAWCAVVAVEWVLRCDGVSVGVPVRAWALVWWSWPRLCVVQCVGRWMTLAPYETQRVVVVLDCRGRTGIVGVGVRLVTRVGAASAVWATWRGLDV